MERQQKLPLWTRRWSELGDPVTLSRGGGAGLEVGSTGSYQHFIPASLIGQFSLDTAAHARRRSLWVARRGGHVFRTTAERVGGVHDLYTLQEPGNQNPYLIDQQWASAESKLLPALTELVHSRGRIKADTFVNLVSFVTSLFVRGLDFTDRFEERMTRKLGEGWKAITGPDNSKFARVFERQRLYYPIMASEWVVLHNVSRVPIVTNDLGYVAHFNPLMGHYGYAVPVNLSTVLVLLRSHTHLRVCWDGSEWWTTGIQHCDVGAEHVEALNKVMAESCLHEVYGPREPAIRHLERFQSATSSSRPPGPSLLVDPNKPLWKTEMYFCSLVSRIGKEPPPELLPMYSCEPRSELIT